MRLKADISCPDRSNAEELDLDSSKFDKKTIVRTQALPVKCSLLEATDNTNERDSCLGIIVIPLAALLLPLRFI